MSGSAAWEFGVIVFAFAVGMLVLRRLITLAVNGTLPSQQFAIAIISLYVTLTAISVGLGLYWLLTTDLTHMPWTTSVLPSLVMVLVIVWVVATVFLPYRGPIWYARAITQLRAERYTEALATIERILRRRRTQVQVWYLKAEALAALDQPVAALDAMDHTLELLQRTGTNSSTQLVPRAIVLADKGFLLVTLHRDAEALAACDEALALAPENMAARAYKAAALQRMGRHDEALAVALHVVDDETGQTSANTQSYALSIMAAAFNDLGRYDEALAVAEREVTLRPQSTRSWLAQAVALAGLGRPGEACVTAEQGLKIVEGRVIARPNSVEVWELHAALLHQLGREPEAEAAEAHARALLA